MTTRVFILQDAAANGPLRELMTGRFVAALLYRFAQVAGRVHPLLGGAVKQLNQFLTGADIAYQAEIGPGLVLLHPVGVVIGVGVRAGSGLRLQQGVTLGGDGVDETAPSSFPTFGDDVRVGAGARVLGGIKVGDRVRIGANSVVLRDSSSDVFAAGVPAVVKRAI